MAYAALVSLSHTIDQFLNHHQYSISLLEKHHMISIHEYTIFLQVFFEDFPGNGSILEGLIRDVANQTEDMIEYFLLEQLRFPYRLTKTTLRPSTRKLIVHYLSGNCTQLCYDLRELVIVAEQIESIAEEVTNIMNRLRIKDRGLNDCSLASSSSRLAPSNKKDAIICLADDLMAINERLCGESSKLQVIPIVGMGGIGKTTLARNAYHHPLITERFDIRAWATVSQDYSAQEILLSLLDSMKQFNSERSDHISNEEKLYKILKGRKYVIVMDDMWSTEAWDDISRILPDDNNGSRVMLTTRLTGVAAYADSSSHHHEMRLMNADQSWNLLRHEVFIKQEYCPLELGKIGMEIARSCGGLPLAIVVIGGILSTVSKTRASWDEIAENVKIIATKNGQLEKMLSLSYTHLPHHLRPCFLYMGAFREDYEINAQKLVKLWAAEGFIKYPNKSKRFDETVHEYLEDLVKRNLILVSKRKSNGKIKSCSIHDLVRELCIRKAQQEKFLLHVTDNGVLEESIKDQRHVSINRSDLNCLENSYDSTIHTLMCFLSDKSSTKCLRNFKILRVLDLVFVHLSASDDEEIMSLPPQVFELFHLRYLAFGFPIAEIPPAISNLQSLQTLVIHPRTIRTFFPCVVNLPLEIWSMPQLRHLVCFNFGELPNPDQDGAISSCALENLHTLSAVTNLICSKNILKMIPKVHKLAIFYSGQEYDQDYHLENLVHLQKLEKLKLTADYSFYFWSKEMNPNFPKTLKKLTLSRWGLPWENMWIVGSLPNLLVLKIRDFACHGEKWETNEGEFSQLRFLLIEGSLLENWISESSHFPRLKRLLLHRCPYLSEIPYGIGEIPTLELIEVVHGEESLVESAKNIQEEQQSYGNDALQVRCLHSTYQS